MQTHLYSVKDIMLGYRYGDLVSSDNKGQRRIDIQRLNNIVAYDVIS